MQNRMIRNRHPGDLLFSLLVLGLLLFFTYVFWGRVPYAGFYFHPASGEVLEIYVDTDPPDLLQKGDIINRVGEISFSSYASDSTQSLFEDVQPGDPLAVSLNRKGEPITISWLIPGFNHNEFLARLFNVWWLAYFFWALGLFVQLSVHPRDARWWLLIASSYLTALWLILGTMSSSHFWGSSLLLRAVTWLILPVYLNLHWVFPRPLAQMPKIIWIILYVVGGALAAGELLQLLPRPLYALGFLLAFLGSLLLLLAHLVWQPAQRRDVWRLLAAIAIAVIPSISLAILRTIGNVPVNGPWGLLALPIMPIAYVYIIYRQNLGGLELRANRILSIYIFLIMLGTILLLLSLPLTQLLIQSGALGFLIVVVGSLTAAISILVFPRFQAFLEQRFMGIKLPYQNLQEIYSTRITTSTSLQSLLELLNDEVIPSLLVRQFAFIQLSTGSQKALLIKGITEDQLKEGDGMKSLAGLTKTNGPSALSSDDLTPSWIRLILPLNIEEDLIGLWLLGDRDPDDVYPQAEIPILQSLANQTAIALSNIIQTERLRSLYQENINRHEQERLRLALDLHDSILNQLAILSLNIDPSSISPKYQEAYDELTQRLREIASDLLPPMLQYGLKPSLEELADNLMERSKDRVDVAVDIQISEVRYSQNIELHLFRIVQEACENALRHGNAGKIMISGSLDLQSIQLAIEDDGTGFEVGENLDPNALLVNKHFGLVGMYERADLIGAEISIRSKPKQGTQIQVLWKIK